MTEKKNIPLGKGSRTIDAFVQTGVAHQERMDTEAKGEVERDVTKTFRLPASLGRRLKVHAAQTGQKEKDILIHLIEGYLDAHETQS